MIRAADEGKIEEVRKYLQDDTIDVNWTDAQGFSALMRACQNGHDHLVEILLDHGANIEATSLLQKENALTISCRNGHVSTCKLLLDRGATIDTKDRYGNEPLHYACTSNSHHILKLLLNRGANINTTSDRGCTPLHRACFWGHTECVQELLNNGVDTEIKTKAGRTPLDIAQDRRFQTVIEVLMKAKKGLVECQEKTMDEMVLKGKSKRFDTEITKYSSARKEDLPVDFNLLHAKVQAIETTLGEIHEHQDTKTSKETDNKFAEKLTRFIQKEEGGDKEMVKVLKYVQGIVQCIQGHEQYNEDLERKLLRKNVWIGLLLGNFLWGVIMNHIIRPTFPS
jgi:hypothetical protein